jgi:hypothetical protein
MTGAPPQSPIIWGAAGAAFESADESGDLHVVVRFDHGALIAVIDGLGHGPEAAAAAREAARVLEARASEPVQGVVEQCHEELRKTRGVVMSVASLDQWSQTLAWIGVGNVEGVLLRAKRGELADEAIVTRGGVVGYQLPPLRASVVRIQCDDTLIMWTDGVRSGFSGDLDLELAPGELAQSIIDRYGKHTDDSLVLVVRFLGSAP